MMIDSSSPETWAMWACHNEREPKGIETQEAWDTFFFKFSFSFSVFSYTRIEEPDTQKCPIKVTTTQKMKALHRITEAQKSLWKSMLWTVQWEYFVSCYSVLRTGIFSCAKIAPTVGRHMNLWPKAISSTKWLIARANSIGLSSKIRWIDC